MASPMQPVDSTDLFASFVAAALILLAGAGYALLYAWGRLRQRPVVLVAAYGAFGVLAASVWVLARTTHLEGDWAILTALLLLGYFLLPRAIFRLCAATHAAGGSGDGPIEPSRTEETP